MTTTGDISESEIKWSSLDGKKCLKLKMFLLQAFGDLGMTVNNKGSIHLYRLNTTISARYFYEKLDTFIYKINIFILHVLLCTCSKKINVLL